MMSRPLLQALLPSALAYAAFLFAVGAALSQPGEGRSPPYPQPLHAARSAAP